MVLNIASSFRKTVFTTNKTGCLHKYIHSTYVIHTYIVTWKHIYKHTLPLIQPCKHPPLRPRNHTPPVLLVSNSYTFLPIHSPTIRCFFSCQIFHECPHIPIYEDTIALLLWAVILCTCACKHSNLLSVISGFNLTPIICRIVLFFEGTHFSRQKFTDVCS